MYTKYFIFSLCVLFCSLCNGQNIVADSLNNNNLTHKVIVKKDSRIDGLIDTHKNSFKQTGYRIQIFSGNKKQPAREAKSRYINLRHKNKAHEMYQQPYFKVRVGDFITKIEALKFQKELVSHFPNSFIVKDEIDIEQLINQ